MRNGTFKSTQASRFEDTESAFARAVRGRESVLRAVLDVGASSGATTTDLSACLRKLGVSASITATDLYVDAHIVTVAPHVRILTDSAGWILQYDVAGTAVRPWIRRMDYLTLAFLPRVVARLGLSHVVPKMVSRGASRSVKLVSPQLSRLEHVSIIENDIMRYAPAFARRFDFIRAANILNTSYFSWDQLRLALVNIRSYLREPGALLLVARSDRAEATAGTLFELARDNTFRVLERVGNGSEIEDLVLTALPDQ
jgi:hypothetical protein